MSWFGIVVIIVSMIVGVILVLAIHQYEKPHQQGSKQIERAEDSCLAQNGVPLYSSNGAMIDCKKI